MSGPGFAWNMLMENGDYFPKIEINKTVITFYECSFLALWPLIRGTHTVKMYYVV